MIQNKTSNSYKSSKVLFVLGSILSVICVLLIVMLYIALGYMNTKVNSTNTSVAEQDTTEQLRQDEWKFEVINATGIQGYEDDVRYVLTQLGYTVISTSSSEIQPTSSLFIRQDMDTKKDMLLEDLSDFFEITTVSSGLSSFGDVNARIILGKE